jgi:hypothetical protein
MSNVIWRIGCCVGMATSASFIETALVKQEFNHFGLWVCLFGLSIVHMTMSYIWEK